MYAPIVSMSILWQSRDFLESSNKYQSEMVAIDRTTWNIIKAELISMHEIVTGYEKRYQSIA